MRPRDLRIGELRLRVPGLTPAAARRLGQAVAQHLAANPPQSAADRIPSLHVKIASRTSGSTGDLAERIAAATRKGAGGK